MDFTLPARVTFVDVSPRDGLQALPQTLPTGLKVELVDRLAEAGCPCIEVTSFVHPKVVPQLADAEAVMAGIRRRPGVVYRGLVPNRRGAERALASTVDEMGVLVTVSDTYRRKNQNMTLEENLRAAAEVYELARGAGVATVTGLATAFFCPYEGLMPESRVLSIVERLVALGETRLVLATTTGMADPAQVYRLLRRVRGAWPQLELGVHLHDTNGMALANALAALSAGATVVEGALCGLGGGIRMPRGIDVGNVASEDLAHMLELMGVQTRIDLRRLRETARWLTTRLGLHCRSHLLRTGMREDIVRQAQSP